MGTSFLTIVLLLAVVFGVVVLLRRGGKQRDQTVGDGDDLLSYLLLAIAVGVAAFSLSTLGRAAFPIQVILDEPARQVAGALAGLVVSVPFVIYLWRLLRARRTTNTKATGWTLYLSLIEAVFMTAFVVTFINLLVWLLADGDRIHWTDLVVFGGVVVFHEFAVRATPDRSDSADWPRIIGSAIGLIALSIGLVGLIRDGLEAIYSTLGEEARFVLDTTDWRTNLAPAIVGALVWWYRWWRPWPEGDSPARSSWCFLVSTASLVVGLGALTSIAQAVFTYLLTSVSSAFNHFDFVPEALALALVALAIWAHHRARLGKERTDSLRAYEYSSAAVGLGVAVAASTSLVATAFPAYELIGGSGGGAVVSATALVAGLLLWNRFWKKAQRAPRETEIVSPPRRTYLLGLGVIMALVSAGALIATLVGVFQMVLGVGRLSDQFPITITLTLTAGAAAWHLLSTYRNDKESVSTGETIAAFSVVVICSHPGPLATRFPEQATLRVVYRADNNGVVDDGMADRIVAEVANRSSYVWVDETGFRVAPAR